MFINFCLLLGMCLLVIGACAFYRWWRGDYNEEYHEYECNCMKELDQGHDDEF